MKSLEKNSAKVRFWGLTGSVFLIFFMTFGIQAYAIPPFYESGQNSLIVADGIYHNWDGVTNVPQFMAPDGSFCFAIDSGDSVTVYKTSGEAQITGTVTLKKQHSTLGTVICDKTGNYYVVTGETNSSNDTNVNTIFISKYDSEGNHITTVGDNGSSSLSWYYNDEFFTQYPFRAGNCDAAICGNILTVNYARKMYSGHQSNSVFSVNITDMSKVNMGKHYQSHSFAQRVIATENGFVYAGEGDCYERAFNINSIELFNNALSSQNDYDIFHFWVKDGALDDYDMSVLNENFAHMGGLVSLSNGKVAFVAQSAKSLDSAASSESEEIFIQIFNPSGKLNSAGAYITSGERSGLSGGNGRTKVTDYGIKWLTSYGKDYSIENVQVAATSNKEIVVLYELYNGRSYKGVYYMVLDETGKITKESTLFATKAKLNPCEMPISYGGKIYWAGNRYKDSNNSVNVYVLDTKVDRVTINRSVSSKEKLTYNGTAQDLINAGEVSGGKFIYALGDSDGEEPSKDKFTENIPTAKDAGIYNVYYQVIGDSSHLDTDIEKMEVKIEKAKAVLPSISANTRFYDGVDRPLVNVLEETSDGILGFSIGWNSIDTPRDDSYTSDVPDDGTQGTHYVWVKVIGDDNHEDSDPICVEVEIKDPLIGFVTRMYQVALNREPDEVGLNDWVTQLKYGIKNGADIAQGFYTSQEMLNKGLSNEEYVELAYKGIMGRDSDEGGKRDWVEALQCGVTYNAIVRGFVGSQEFNSLCANYDIYPGEVQVTENRDKNVGITKFVSRLYTEVLGRSFDEGGLNDWTGQINANPSKENILNISTNGFLHSQEFANRGLSNEDYVRVMYGTYLGREADEAGFNDWVSQLNNGRSRDDIASGFANSQEFANILAQYGL